MNESFSARVYPVITHVLDLLEKAEGTGGSEPTPSEILPRLKQMVGTVDSDGPDRKQLELARRALVYWVDEVLVNSSWSHAEHWQNNTLEREIYDARDRAWKFFDAARSARSFSRSDCLETFYLCVALGFRGVYREKQGPTEKSASQSEAPPPTEGGENSSFTWFGESGSFNSEDTWGLGSLPGQRDSSLIDQSLVGANIVPSDGESYGLPRTLEEWSGPVFAQVAPPINQNFVPSSAAEGQRDARPMRNRRSFQTTMQILIGSLVLTLLLLVLWLLTS